MLSYSVMDLAYDTLTAFSVVCFANTEENSGVYSSCVASLLHHLLSPRSSQLCSLSDTLVTLRLACHPANRPVLTEPRNNKADSQGDSLAPRGFFKNTLNLPVCTINSQIFIDKKYICVCMGGIQNHSIALCIALCIYWSVLYFHFYFPNVQVTNLSNL